MSPWPALNSAHRRNVFSRAKSLSAMQLTHCELSVDRESASSCHVWFPSSCRLPNAPPFSSSDRSRFGNPRRVRVFFSLPITFSSPETDPLSDPDPRSSDSAEKFVEVVVSVGVLPRCFVVSLAADDAGVGVREMFVSRPAVQPVEAPSPANAAENPPRLRMKDIQGMPGTAGGLALRLSQFVFAVAALGVMESTSNFGFVTVFCNLFHILQLSDRSSHYAEPVEHVTSFSGYICSSSQTLLAESPSSVYIYHWGWGKEIAQIISTLTFSAACASAGITILLRGNGSICSHEHCTSFETAIAIAFISWFVICPSFLLNFWSLASS
ncbi:hypothetical protein B296_00043682 [Ensete ventricosum]|uniref:CASP-like protein n=1 Tax=Ensete ventricosum TaxID=4639 RepID=A0A426ZDJ6_ENSVE|nr:hypothetical protein B296_00043682 [Ensete ventricosum]